MIEFLHGLRPYLLCLACLPSMASAARRDTWTDRWFDLLEWKPPRAPQGGVVPLELEPHSH